MPRRPRSHVTADIAVSRVMSICNELGWACEVIQKDYGEDLWIQTTIGDEVDHCRIWFQVKATESISTYERKEGQLVFRVDTDHALRWARNLELVVFVLWDINNDVGYWTLPQDNVTDLDLLKTRKKTARLFLDNANQFTKVTAGKLSWLARIDHYETLMAVAQQRIIQNERESKIGIQNPLNSQARMNLLCYDFLRAIGFFDQNGRIDTSVGRKVISEMELILLDRPNSDNASLCMQAVTLVLLGKVKDLADCGLPGFLLWESVRFGASALLRNFERAGLNELNVVLKKRLSPKKSRKPRRKGKTPRT